MASITINYQRVADLGYDLSLQEIVIITYIKDNFFNSNFQRINEGGKEYCSITHHWIFKSLPILGVSKDRIYRYMCILVSKGFLYSVKYNGYLYYRVSQTGQSLFSSDISPEEESSSEAPSNKHLGENTEGSVKIPTIYINNILYNSIVGENTEGSVKIPRHIIIEGKKLKVNGFEQRVDNYYLKTIYSENTKLMTLLNRMIEKGFIFTDDEQGAFSINGWCKRLLEEMKERKMFSDQSGELDYGSMWNTIKLVADWTESKGLKLYEGNIKNRLRKFLSPK